VTLERRQPLNACQVVNWEQRHCVYLPEDMKKFYLSSDGFILNWSYQYAREWSVLITMLFGCILPFQLTIFGEWVTSTFHTCCR